MNKPTKIENFRYFVYCRKSTDEDNRQVQSIDSQIAEAKEYALANKLEVVQVFTESKTAKEPGREIFNQMIELLENGVANAIISWHPDRLARNSIDGGRIIYLMDRGVIKDLKFPTYWIDNSPQGKFSLSLAFGQSKYYVDSLSQNIKRGQKTKLKKGEWPTQALLGYLNRDRKIVPDPEKFYLVQKLFYEYGSGNYTMAEIRLESFKWGLRSKGGNMLSKSMIQNTLKNPFYAGVLVYSGERYEGTHTPVINIGKFLQIQKVMKIKGKPSMLKRKKGTTMYHGLFYCGECGCSITSEVKKGHTYYRCTKKKGTCSQRYIREEEVNIQIKEQLKRISIDVEVKQAILAGLKERNKIETGAYIGSLDFWHNEIKKIELKKSRFYDLYSDGSIPKEDLDLQIGQLVMDLQSAKQTVKECEKAGNRWLEQYERMIIVAHMAHLIFSKGDLYDRRELLISVGSNFILKDKKIEFTWLEPFDIIVDHKGSTDWLRDLDSNQDRRLQRPLSYH